MSPTDPRPEMTALARDVDRVARGLDSFKQETVERVLDLDTRVTRLADTFADAFNQTTVFPQSWLLVDDPSKAREMLADLIAWLDAVYLRFPDAKLPACWMWHPTVIEELWILRCVHADALSGRGWQVKYETWLMTYRQKCLERISASVGTCDLEWHAPGGKKELKPRTAPLARHFEAVADAWTSRGVPPEPTDEQVRDAEACDAEKYEAAPR